MKSIISSIILIFLTSGATAKDNRYEIQENDRVIAQILAKEKLIDHEAYLIANNPKYQLDMSQPDDFRLYFLTTDKTRLLTYNYEINKNKLAFWLNSKKQSTTININRFINTKIPLLKQSNHTSLFFIDIEECTARHLNCQSRAYSDCQLKNPKSPVPKMIESNCITGHCSWSC